MVVVLCSLLLSGCGDIGDILADLFHINGNGNGNGNAEAQGDRLIETFVIQAGTFRLETDSEPTIEIFDGTTQYTLGAGNADLSFTREGAADPTSISNLETGDIVIERPASGAVTVIRDSD
jgi:hypothetical protein